jgi:hypothetical protein
LALGCDRGRCLRLHLGFEQRLRDSEHHRLTGRLPFPATYA